MSQNKGVEKILFLTILLLLSSLSPLFNQTTTLEQQEASNVSPLLNVTNFVTGLSSTSVQADIGGSAVIDHQSGHRLLNASVDVEVLPQTSTGVWFDALNNAQALGILDNTSAVLGGVQLPSVNSGPPGSGNNSSTLFNAVQWSGTHSYDTLELRCGIVSCGSIEATGSLTIMVRVLVVESGTSISASGIYSGGTSTGGSTTATPGGNSDGAGGAGHGGSGGSGGATGGGAGAGGSTYGNGTEDGSQGGSVTSSNHPNANGGYGGGYIRIIADQIHVNGTIVSNGEDGTNGQAINGGSGAGGSGAGGGSGGSIALKANEVNIGTSGAIQADGGNGGNGASSFCTGACIGFFHGGDGGGGGGGGRISIQTQISKYNNQGTVSVNGGTGGTGGQPYGTGAVGVVGSAGASGVSSISTWNGYILSNGTIVDDGTFTTNTLSPNGGNIIDGWVNHSASVPSDSSLVFSYRYTVSGVLNNTSTLWSDWNIGNISQQKLPRLTGLQLSYHFNRTSTSSPVLSDITLEWTLSHSLTNLEIAIFSGPQVLGPSSLALTSSNNATVVSSVNSHTATLSVPTSSTPTSPLHMWIAWPTNAASNTFDVSLGATTVYSGALNSSLGGIDVAFSLQHVLDAWPSIGTLDSDGIEIGELVVNISTTLTAQIDVHHTQMSWSWTHTVDLMTSMTQHAFATCTDWYRATSSCLSQYSFELSGDTVPLTSPGFTITLDNLSLEWIDDIAPQISTIDHRIGLSIGAYIRVGDTFIVTVEDAIGDDSLSGSAWIHQGDSTKPTVPSYLAFFSGLNRYVTSFPTNEYDPLTPTQHFIAVELTDDNDNTLFVEQAYSFEIGPVIPSVTSVTMDSVNSTLNLSSGTQSSPAWVLHEEGYEFSVAALQNRSDLSASLTLNKSGSGTPTILPLTWDGTTNAYTALWSPQRFDLGTWDVEVELLETTGQQARDVNGYQNGVDLTFTLVDQTGPVLTSIIHQTTVVKGEDLLVEVQWENAPSELIDGYVHLLFDGTLIANQSIAATSTSTSSMTFQTDSFDTGIYTLFVALFDEYGNAAVSLNSSSSFELFPMAPLVSGVLESWSFDPSLLNLTLSGEHQFRFSQGLVSLSSGGVMLLENSSVSNGVWTIEQALDSILQPSMNILVHVCDATDSVECEDYELSIDASSAIDYTLEIQCMDASETFLINSTETFVSCTIAHTNGTSSMQVSLTSLQPSSFLLNTVVTEELPISGQIELSLLINTGMENGTWSLPWVLSVVDRIGQVEVLEQRTASFTIISVKEESSNESKDTLTTTESDSSLTNYGVLLVILALCALFGTLGFLKMRGKEETQEELQNFDSGDHHQAETTSQAIPVETSQHPGALETPMLTETPVESLKPSSDAIPTATDEHGYEWYTEENGTNWYRLQGNGTEWYLHQG